MNGIVLKHIRDVRKGDTIVMVGNFVATVDQVSGNTIEYYDARVLVTTGKMPYPAIIGDTVMVLEGDDT